MTADLIACLELVLGHSLSPTVAPWDGAPEQDPPDLFVSDDDADRMQERYDNWLIRDVS